MTTELKAAADAIGAQSVEKWAARLIIENDELRRRCDRLRREADDYRELLSEMRKRVSDLMNASLDDFK